MERPSSVFYRLLEEIGMKRFYIALCALLTIVAPSCTPEAQDDQAGISGGSQTEEPKDEPVPLPAEFKVMSFNVKVDGTNDATTVNGWGSRKQVCVQMIRKYSPAIIGLQEANCTNQWLWLKNELKDSHTTYNGWKEDKQSIIDHIYVSNEVEVLEYHTIYEKYGDCPFISDHYPIISHIRIN